MAKVENAVVRYLWTDNALCIAGDHKQLDAMRKAIRKGGGDASEVEDPWISGTLLVRIAELNSAHPPKRPGLLRRLWRACRRLLVCVG